MAAKAAPAPAQVSMEEQATIARDEKLVKRLETMRNWIADLEARLPSMQREMDSLIEELRRR